MTKADPFSDLEEASTAVSQRSLGVDPSKAFVVFVVDGPDKGKRFVVDGSAPSPSLLGTSPSCVFRLTDRQISRRHAAFELVGSSLRLTDLESTNGTRVGSTRIESALLDGNETVALGATTLRIERLADSTAPLLSEVTNFSGVIGGSVAMRRLYPVLERLANAMVSVIIEGETGTGKEVVAEALHAGGPRANGPFVVFDCTTVPPNLVESELFGHERGAFTGAVGARRGVFEQAHGGTLLIDEIGDLDIMLQPKLLRCIERSEVRRVGGSQSTRVDVRVLAATRRDLDKAVQEGRFRDDLFHRLAVGRVELPPLRRRNGDVGVLARHFWNSLGGAGRPIPPAVLQRWENDLWPGNVRELRNAVARQLTLGDMDVQVRGPRDEMPPSAASGIGDFIDQVIAPLPPLPVGRLRVVEEYERRYIERVLAAHGGNVVHAAAASGIARRYFQILKKARS